MAKLSSKLRSVLKKVNSFGKQNSRKNYTSGDIISTVSSSSSSSVTTQIIEQRNLQKVYVGRSRREYQVPTELLNHPVIRELFDTSANDDDDGSVIGCEVVLFDHLCWMLEEEDSTAGPGHHHQQQQIDAQLATFYAY